MNIDILNRTHGGIIKSIKNYLFIKNKSIRKLNTFFYWISVNQCSIVMQKFRLCENNVHHENRQ